MSILGDYIEAKKVLRDLQNLKENLRGQDTSFANSSVSIVGLKNSKEVTVPTVLAQQYLDYALRSDHARPIVNDAIRLAEQRVASLSEAAKAEYKRLFDEEFPAG